MTKISRRGFLLGSTALVAASAEPAPVRILAGPIGGTMTPAPVLNLRPGHVHWVTETAPVMARALDDLRWFGRCAVHIARDGSARHVPLEELDGGEPPST